MLGNAVDIPDKNFFKIGEVCRITDTQPYVLRFWESEFPSLAPEKTRSGQRLYRRGDIEMVLRIKHLLYEESYTIAGARKQLEQADNGPQAVTAAPAPAKKAAGKTKAAKAAPRKAAAKADEGPAENDERLEWVRNELRDLLIMLDDDPAAGE